MADIDSLSISLSADTSSAEESINKLIGRLALLKVAVQGASNFTKIAGGIAKIAEAARKIDEDSGKKLSNLAQGLMDLSKVGDLGNLGAASKNLSNIVRAVNDIGKTNGGGLGNLASEIERTGSALDSIKSADTSKLREIQDALSGETSGPLYTSSRQHESAELGGGSATYSTGGDMQPYGAMTVYTYVASSIRDATAAYQEFVAALGGGVPPVFTEFVDSARQAVEAVRMLTGSTGNAMTVYQSPGGPISNASQAYQDFASNAPNQAEVIETTFADVAESAENMAERVRRATDDVIHVKPQPLLENEEIKLRNRFADYKMKPLEEETPRITLIPVDDGAAESVSNLTSAFSALGSVLGGVGRGLGSVGKFLFAIPQYFGGQLIGNIQQATKGFTGLFNSIKRIAMYRAIRSALRLITQHIGEGIKNLYQWSSIANGTFVNSMNSIASASHYMGNSFAAMVSPLINALAPAIDYIANKVVALFNLINMLFARLTGQTSYTAAKKFTTQWDSASKSASGSAKKAADEIKRTLLGFDEINKLNDNNENSGGGGGGGGGGGASAADMFETLPIDSEVANFVDSLKAAFEAGDWQELGTLLGNKVNEIVESIDWAGYGAKVGYYVNGWFSTKYWTLDTINFTNIGKHIAEFLNNAINEIDFNILGRLMVQKLGIIGDLVIGFFMEFDWGQAATKLSNFVSGLFDEIAKWFDKYDWTTIGSTLAEKILEFISNIDVEGVASSVCKALTSAIKAGIDLISSFAIKLVIEPIVTNVAKIVNAINGNGDVDWKDVSAILKSLALGTSLFLAATGNYSGAVVALGVAVMIEPIVNGVADIVNQIKADGGISWDRIAGIVKILAASAGMFLLAKGQYGAGIVALGIAISIEPIVNNVSDIVNQLKTDGGISWDRIAGIIKILAANAGLFLLARGNYGAGIVALGVALTIEPIVNGIVDIVNQIKADGGISWDRIVGIVRILAAGAGIFLLTHGSPVAGVVALGVALTIEPIVNGISAIVNKLSADGGISWDRIAGIVRILAFGSSLFLLTHGHPVAGVVALGVALTIEPIVNGITDIISDIKTNGLTWDSFRKIIGDSLMGLGLLMTIGGNPVGGLISLTIGVSLRYKIVDSLFESTEGNEPEPVQPSTSSNPTSTSDSGIAQGLGFNPVNIAGDPTMWEPIQIPVTTTPPATVAQTFKSEWDKLTESNKEVKFAGDVVKKTGFELGNVFGKTYTAVGDVLAKAGFTLGKVFGVDLTVLGTLKPKDGNQNPSTVFKVANVLGFLGSLTRKNGSKTPGEVFNSGSNFGYTGTLSRNKDSKKPSEVFDSGSNYKYTGTLSRKNDKQKPANVFSAGSTFSYKGTLKKGWSGTPQKALGIDNLKTTITANFKKGTNDTVQVSGGGGTWRLAVKELGGIFSNGRWSNIPQYASGTLNAGSVFVAGEAGPELVGHVGGRTEVLNKSQLASAMYSAVHSAMSGVTLEANVYSESGNGDMDYDTMYRAMYNAFSAALARGDERDREKLALMREIAAKDFNPEITAASINRAQTRMNRRAGTTIVPVGT